MLFLISKACKIQVISNLDQSKHRSISKGTLKEHLKSIAPEGCTVPSCHFPHPFRGQRPTSSAMEKSGVRCHVKDMGNMKSIRVECSLQCQKHWKPINGTTMTTCFPEANRDFDAFTGMRKLTNFTIDYLECQREH